MLTLFGMNKRISRNERLQNRADWDEVIERFLRTIFEKILQSDEVQKAVKLVEQSNKEDRQDHLRVFRTVFIKRQNEWVAEALKRQGRDQKIDKTWANSIRGLRPAMEFQAALY